MPLPLPTPIADSCLPNSNKATLLNRDTRHSRDMVGHREANNRCITNNRAIRRRDISSSNRVVVVVLGVFVRVC
jgi:hypothetical protein